MTGPDRTDKADGRPRDQRRNQPVADAESLAGGLTDLDQLGTRLRKAREASRLAPERVPPPPSNLAGSVLGQGMRMAIELVVAIGAGAAIGYGLDHWLGTGPWLLIVFLFVGAAGGTLNVLRAARLMPVPPGPGRQASPAHGDPENGAAGDNASENEGPPAGKSP